jgi:hypothetical protein
VTVNPGSWISVGLALVIAAGAIVAFRRLRGTTLAAPAAWAVVSALLIAAVEAMLRWRGPAVDTLAVSLWRYAAAAGTFCPLMAVLGAKRPQDRGWQWVVLALWVILLVPALQAVAARSGQELELYAVSQLLLEALVVMGLLNYLPTRYAPAAMLFALGQIVLLAPYLFEFGAGPKWQRSGLVAIIAAMAAAAGLSRRAATLAPGACGAPSSLTRLNQRWSLFRDGWGAFWGLRVLQRVNQTAELSHWPVRLDWRKGFVRGPSNSPAADDDPRADEQIIAHIQQTLDSLLRRFERLEESESEISANRQ